MFSNSNCTPDIKFFIFFSFSCNVFSFSSTFFVNNSTSALKLLPCSSVSANAFWYKLSFSWRLLSSISIFSLCCLLCSCNVLKRSTTFFNFALEAWRFFSFSSASFFNDLICAAKSSFALSFSFWDSCKAISFSAKVLCADANASFSLPISSFRFSRVWFLFLISSCNDTMLFSITDICSLKLNTFLLDSSISESFVCTFKSSPDSFAFDLISSWFFSATVDCNDVSCFCKSWISLLDSWITLDLFNSSAWRSFTFSCSTFNISTFFLFLSSYSRNLFSRIAISPASSLSLTPSTTLAALSDLWCRSCSRSLLAILIWFFSISFSSSKWSYSLLECCL